MKPIKAIIVDDEENCRIVLKELLNKDHPDVLITGEASSVKSASKLLSGNSDVDIVFLDIQMPEGDGFSLLQQLEHVSFHVIFTTAYDQYAIKAIKFSALDYLLKPIDTDDLEIVMNKYRQLRAKNKHSAIHAFGANASLIDPFGKLAIPSLSDIVFVPVQDIVYLESYNTYTTVHTTLGEKLTSSKNIGYYEDLLSDLDFFRVHNSHMINLKKIKRYIKGKSGTVEMENGSIIHISTRRKDEFLQLLRLI